MKYWLRGIGVVTSSMGALCLPLPVVSPKQATGLWAWATASGNFVKPSLIIMLIGALFFLSSFLIKNEEAKKCPYKVGDRVKFVPGERTIGWHQPKMESQGLHAGYVGTVTQVKDGIYIYLDGDKGGFPWTDFQKVN